MSDEANLALLVDALDKIVLINSSVGGVADSASTSGSVNAKISALLERLGSGTPNLVTAYTDSTTPVTLCNVSGSGMLWMIKTRESDLSDQVLVTLIVDGITKFTDLQFSSDTNSLMIAPISFSSSLVITIRDVNTNGTSVAASFITVGGA